MDDGIEREIRMRLSAGIIALALGMGLLPLALHPARSEDTPPPLTPAQIALFETNHLKSISQPAVLEYSFTHHGGTAGDFTDKVTAEIRGVHDDGKKDVWIDFLTGEHKVEFAPVLGFGGNPVLMLFLENDVREMQQATGGSSHYFRNQIRRAFLYGAEIHPVDFMLDGKPQTGKEIMITPFRGDPHADRFPAYVEKSYHFILSDAVPGMIYQISTHIPPSEAKPAPFEDSMTYVSEHP